MAKGLTGIRNSARNASRIVPDRTLFDTMVRGNLDLASGKMNKINGEPPPAIGKV